MVQDRRRPWDGVDRRRYFHDPKEFASSVAAHLDAIAVARSEAAERAKNERTGRYVTSWEFRFRVLRAIGLIGAPILAWLHGAGKITFSLFSAG